MGGSGGPLDHLEEGDLINTFKFPHVSPQLHSWALVHVAHSELDAGCWMLEAQPTD